MWGIDSSKGFTAQFAFAGKSAGCLKRISGISLRFD